MDYLKKVAEILNKSGKFGNNPTWSSENKLQHFLRNLYNEGKLDEKTHR